MGRRRLRAELAGSTLKEEEMRHPSSVWTDPDFATEPLDKLVAEYIRHLEGRSHPVSPDTVDKYRNDKKALDEIIAQGNEAGGRAAGTIAPARVFVVGAGSVVGQGPNNTSRRGCQLLSSWLRCLLR